MQNSTYVRLLCLHACLHSHADKCRSPSRPTCALIVTKSDLRQPNCSADRNKHVIESETNIFLFHNHMHARHVNGHVKYILDFLIQVVICMYDRCICLHASFSFIHQCMRLLHADPNPTSRSTRVFRPQGSVHSATPPLQLPNACTTFEVHHGFCHRCRCSTLSKQQPLRFGLTTR